MTASLMPGLPILIGALFVPLLRGHLQKGFLLLLPIIGLAQLMVLDHGSLIQLSLFEYELNPVRIDRLSLVWGYIFHIALLLNIIFSLHVRDNVQHIAGLVYAGSAIGAAFAGDLITLFVYWELTAVASVFLIWAVRTERSYRAGMRYLIVQVGSGVLLLAGILILVSDTGSLAFDRLELIGVGPWLIFTAFGIKAAFPLLHGWLQDAYPEATVTGTVFLSAFTTKLAIYALARSFPGTEILIPIGAAMTVFPIFFAVIENDLRRVLTYSLNNQLGFMVVGVGIGTELSINGTAAHAFAHILYKALLFMSMGAVLYRTGTIKGSELGGLYRSMPWTTAFCCIGAASISAFPLFSGFVSKSLIVSAAGDGHYLITWLILLFASAGVFHHSGIKIPYFAFFAHDSGIRCKEAPLNMLIAMGITATLCIAIGVFPSYLYSILPYAVDYQPYTTSHVITQLQLLMFSALAFIFLQRTGLYPPELPSVNLDIDAIYRRVLPFIMGAIGRITVTGRDRIITTGKKAVSSILVVVERYHGRRGIFARTWTTSSSVLIVLVFLALYLLLYL
jgi:multicomponent Na+:H+ antiporter subunit D